MSTGGEHIDPRTPCLIGVATRTWHPGADDAPEPLAMWEQVAREAAADCGNPAALDRVESLCVVHCLTTDYDDPPGRLAERLGIDPRHRVYSGIGGTTPQVLVNETATSIMRGELELVLVAGAEALHTRRRFQRRGEPYVASFPPSEPRPFPWEAPHHPAEVAHDVWEAWLTFATFDSARRGHLGIGLEEYRQAIGRMMAPMTEVAASNPDAWFRTRRSVDEIVTATPENRMIGYPYTKYMVSVMDVDQGAALLLASHGMADALGVPRDRRVYPRGWCFASDQTYVAEHPEMWHSPAMTAASEAALRAAGVGVDDVSHLDLYSCFASSISFARDSLGLADDDPRPLTVTGGLPYHGGAGSNYLTHSIAAMVRTLRDDAGSLGVVSGVGMHMTKHVFAVYSTTPGLVVPPDETALQARLDEAGKRNILDFYEGEATVTAYSVVHGREGTPEWGLVVCEARGGDRCYAKMLDHDLLASAEQRELVGTVVRVHPEIRGTAFGEARFNLATL